MAAGVGAGTLPSRAAAAGKALAVLATVVLATVVLATVVLATAGGSAAGSLRPAKRARKAFSVTRIEEPDIASAAMSGVIMPAIATGTASAL